MPRLLILIAVFSLAGCGQQRIDGSSAEAAKASAEVMKEDMSDAERAAFEEALRVVVVNKAMPGGNWLANAGKPPEQAVGEMLGELNGLTAAELIAKADAIKAAEKKKQRDQALAEIAELRIKQDDATQAALALQSFEVTRSRFRMKDQKYGRPQPIIELSVRNGTQHAVSRAYFVGKLATPGRSVPWLVQEFNYPIPGGIEPGEKADWTLAPNMFSKWGTTEIPADAVFTVTVERLDGPDGEAVLDSSGFSQSSAKRLAELEGLVGPASP